MSGTTTVDGIAVMPWGIEADHPRMCDLLLQCIPGTRMRSAIDGSKPVQDVKTGDWYVPLGQSEALASFPRTPGEQLFVHPEKLTYKIIDPLFDNEELLSRIERYFHQRQGIKPTGKLNGNPIREGKLDIHQMKSLNREMFNLVEAKEAKLIHGGKPDMNDIDALPGFYLLNPGSVVPNNQPRYEKDLDSWVANLSHSGM